MTTKRFLLRGSKRLEPQDLFAVYKEGQTRGQDPVAKQRVEYAQSISRLQIAWFSTSRTRVQVVKGGEW